MPAVALPAVRRPLGREAADLIATAAFLALPAPTDVVDDDAIALAQPPHAGAQRHDLAGRLMSADHPLVGLRALPEMLAVDGPQVAAADRGRPHREHHLTVARRGIGDLAQVDPAPAGQVDTEHRGAQSCGWTTALTAPGSSRLAVRACSAWSRRKLPVTSRSTSTRPASTSAIAVGQVLA